MSAAAWRSARLRPSNRCVAVALLTDGLDVSAAPLTLLARGGVVAVGGIPNLQLWVHRNDALGMVDLPTLAESAKDAHDIERDALRWLA